MVYDEFLARNQKGFWQRHQWLVDTLREVYTPGLIGFTNIYDEALAHHADKHDKRLLRIHAWSDGEIDGTNHNRLWLQSVWYKMKKDEIAKPGKYPRMIGDLGVAASLQGFVLTGLLKHTMEDEVLHVNGGHIEFCASPTPEKLRVIFAKLVDPPGRFYFVYFSDDSCLSIRDAGGVIHRYNLDISSCDTSHREALFDAFEAIFPPHLQEYARVLTDQCRLPIRLYSVDRQHRCVLKPHGPVLYSGSTITTAINNLANISNAIAISECDFTGVASITAACESAGYIVTCENCDNWHDLQFLKHSPVLDEDGQIQPLLNLGVLLRASGTCRGDLPGRGDIKLRAEVFQKALLQGAYPQATFTLLERMRASVSHAALTDKALKKAATVFEHKVVAGKSSVHYRVSDDEVYARYRLTAAEVDALHLYLGGASVFSAVQCSGASKILNRDYGL